MKRVFSLVISICLILTMAACVGNADKTLKLGLGIVADVSSSAEGKAQVNGTVAAVVLDSKGEIVDCKIDAFQNGVSIKDGKVDKTAKFMTKQELKDNYGMRSASAIKKEWNEQADYFAEYVVGMKVDEVINFPTKANDYGAEIADGYFISAGCTIGVSDFVKAVVAACKDSNAATVEEFDGKLQLSVKTNVDPASADATAAEDGAVKITSAVTASLGNLNITDTLSPEIKFNAAGVPTNTEGYSVDVVRSSAR